ncbi:AMP-binding enzyme, partial [Nocardia cyriacigeorgica]|uniref:AMP-binding enzyme n=1 Tax=Nocardia cyriacigeorgica TaxID=135487 RepID=UPI003CC7CD21
VLFDLGDVSGCEPYRRLFNQGYIQAYAYTAPWGSGPGPGRRAPHVADAAVLAVPDDVMGEKVGAVLFADGAEIDVDAVIAHCREQLADFKVPQYVTVVDQALPRNAGGKLLKAQLREQIRWGAPLR